MKRLVTILLLVLVVLPMWCQPSHGAEIKDLLSGQMFPLTLQLKDLDSEWRRVSIGGQTESLNILDLYSAMFVAGSGTYYTKGQTVAVDGQAFLVAYRMYVEPLSYDEMVARTERHPASDKLKPESQLAVAYLNLRAIGRLSDIRPFDLDAEIATAAGAAKEQEEDRSTNNLRQVMLAALMYAADHKEALPPMKDSAAVRRALHDYLKSDDVFTNPIDHQPYRANALLSGKKVAHIEYPSQMIVFYEASAADDGTRAAAFLDGHVKRLNAAEWERFKKISKMP